jgi:uncharacterized zinc-type alcohol dehydrogenase-like protein
MKKVTAIILLVNMLMVQAFSQEGPIPSKGFALFSKDGSFQPFEFTRHAVGDHEILIEILYSGICHSDIHTVKGEWGDMKYPLVPGHEIAGRVTRVGKNVTKFKVGDYAGVGCMVNACGNCEFCLKGEEQYCLNGLVLTYASFDKGHQNEWTQGGYSNNMVLSEKFALKIPKNADIKRVAPLLCAGITTYSPIKSQQIKKGDVVAVAGFGGLGHLAVQYAVKLGAKVTVFDITEDKRQAALDMGAVKYVNVNNSDELKGLENTYRFILSTIPAKYDLGMYLRMLKLDGELVIVGLPAIDNQPLISVAQLVTAGRRKVSGSMIGGIRETQEMLDYSVANNIYPQIEMIPIQQIDEAYKKVLAGRVHFRYVIDMGSLK